MSHPNLHLRDVLLVCGALHFLQIPSLFALSRGTLNLGRDLVALSPINARIITLFVAAVTFLLLGLGGLIVLQRDQLLSSAFGRGVCWLLGAFWLLRASAQWFWLRGVWPRAKSSRRLYYGLLGLYACLALCYLSVAAS
jgi:hypothetical protein